MALYTRSMPTRAQGLPDASQLVNGNDGACGSHFLNPQMVPCSLEELGLVMDEEGDMACSWDHGMAHVGSQLADGNHTSSASSTRVISLGNKSICVSGGSIVSNVLPIPTGQQAHTMPHSAGHPPFADSGPRMYTNRSGTLGSGPGPAPPSHRPVAGGHISMRLPVTYGMMPVKERVMCVSESGMPSKYVMVQNSGAVGNSWNVVGRVVRGVDDPRVSQGRMGYIVNDKAGTVPGGRPSPFPPPLIHAAGADVGIGDAYSPAFHSPENGLFPVVPTMQGVSQGQDQGSGMWTHRFIPLGHPRELQFQNVVFRNRGSGGYVRVNSMPGKGALHESTEMSNGTAGMPHLQSALLGFPSATPDDSSMGHFLEKQQANDSAKVSTAAIRRRNKGALVDMQQIVASYSLNSIQRHPSCKERNSGSAKGRRRKKDAPLLEGEAEEIVVEVDLPMLMSDSDEEVQELEGVGDPLAPSNEDIMAVDSMRSEKGSNPVTSWSPLLNVKRHFIVIQKTGKIIGGKTSRGVERCIVNVKGASGLPLTKFTPAISVLRECSVRLERCDAPGGILYQRTKEAQRTANSSSEKKSTQKEGSEPKSVSSELVSPSGSLPSKTQTKPQETDYWLQMLDRERREALEALEVVRKRLEEEKLSLSSSLDDRRWTLLEEEFRRRDEIRRKSISDTNDVSEQPSPVTKSSDSAVVGVCAEESLPERPLEVPRKMTTEQKEDLPASASHVSCKLDGDSPSERISDGDHSASVGFSKSSSDAVINDPRISELQKSRTVGSRGMPKMRECCVKLERCDRGTVAVASGSRLAALDCGVERVPGNSNGIMVDSVEMRSVAMSTGPVTQGDQVSQASLVCLQGRVGLKRTRRRGSTAEENSPLSPEDRQVASLPSDPARSYVMVEMKKLVVVMKKVDRKVELQMLKNCQLRSLEGPNTDGDSDCGGRVMRSGSRDAGDVLPKLKDCYVRLEKCDQVVGLERRDNGGPPRPKRQKRDPV